MTGCRNPSHSATPAQDLCARLQIHKHRLVADAYNYSDALAADLACAIALLGQLERERDAARAIFRTRSDDAIARDKNGREREAARVRRS